MVALREEGVDRNFAVWVKTFLSLVALREEGVDRNCLVNIYAAFAGQSLSARRAWIEIDLESRKIYSWLVALREEGVDRNTALVM